MAKQCTPEDNRREEYFGERLGFQESRGQGFQANLYFLKRDQRKEQFHEDKKESGSILL